MKRLQELYLRNNQLTTLPKEIGKLQKLNTLNLDDIPALKSQEKKIQKLLPKASIYFIEITKE
nr:leucine-rich repeat domain-containing protein [Leptospira kirschneri]